MAVELNSVQDVLDWLNRPENQFDSLLFIVRWDGHTPTIARRKLVELNNPDDRGLAEVVLIEHTRRKRRPDEQEPVEREEQ
jgi:hypothetical protein